ncbi:uncharacterized protein N7482_006819 [Penicillium canariense]|uniref:Uncharacterized protein n=1 Tax=Penicillium canariense TaxID=189055 RepID=A0A9W9LJA9_9EURO|nr:uncharacterized protein N7482_006819 [Penicillium canariense]KAJ5159815.1 hypothetical protein N7482_006819 [Penicillium canariense]
MEVEYFGDDERDQGMHDAASMSDQFELELETEDQQYGTLKFMEYTDMASENPYHAAPEFMECHNTFNENLFCHSLFGEPGPALSDDAYGQHSAEVSPHAPNMFPDLSPKSLGRDIESCFPSTEAHLPLMPDSRNMRPKSDVTHRQPPEPCDESSLLESQIISFLQSKCGRSLNQPAEHVENTLNIDTLNIGSDSGSDSDSSKLHPEPHKQKILWGETGLLGIEQGIPTPKSAQSKSGLIRDLGKRLKNQLAEIVEESNKSIKIKHSPASSPVFPGSSHASPITSLDSVTQAKLYSELEVMICNTANDFILRQYYDGRVSQHSIDKVNAFWASKNRPRVTEFRFDQATQRELIQANRRSMEFTDESVRYPIRVQCNLHNWKVIAQEMSIRTFCLPDSAIRKHLYDLRLIINMMNPSFATLRSLHDLTFWAQDQMLDKLDTVRRQSEARSKMSS